MPRRKRPKEPIIRTTPDNYVSPWIPWKRKDLFRLRQLETITNPTKVEQERISYLRQRIYGNLQWFRKVRAHKNDNDTPSPTK